MKNLEQPKLENLEKEGENNEQFFDDVNKVSVEKLNRADEGSNQITSNSGSQNLGKFKDAESLLKAYNALQSEFTKKSQRLSELEGEMKPLEKQDKINAVLKEIEDKYTFSKPFKDALKENLLLSDGEDYKKLAEQNLLELLAKNYKSPDEMVKDEMFLSNYIFNNKDIKEAIVKEYLSQLKSAPKIKVATNFNSSILATPPKTVQTINEAGNIAKYIIKKL